MVGDAVLARPPRSRLSSSRVDRDACCRTPSAGSRAVRDGRGGPVRNASAVPSGDQRGDESSRVLRAEALQLLRPRPSAARCASDSLLSVVDEALDERDRRAVRRQLDVADAAQAVVIVGLDTREHCAGAPARASATIRTPANGSSCAHDRLPSDTNRLSIAAVGLIRPRRFVSGSIARDPYPPCPRSADAYQFNLSASST